MAIAGMRNAGRLSRPAIRPALPPFARRLLAVCTVLLLTCGPHTSVSAVETTYLSRGDFLATVFGGTAPEPRLLWLNAGMKTDVREILGHAYPGIRIRYWSRGFLTAWILEEIGKYKPITVGIAVKDGKIERFQVLVYRESHGWEVRYPFFTNQFQDIRLTDDRNLSREIDGISGATLSVNALTRLARLALYFHQQAVGRP